jgi:hypothetical protein
VESADELRIEPAREHRLTVNGVQEGGRADRCLVGQLHTRPGAQGLPRGVASRRKRRPGNDP